MVCERAPNLSLCGCLTHTHTPPPTTHIQAPRRDSVDWQLTAASTFAELLRTPLDTVLDWLGFVVTNCPTVSYVTGTINTRGRV